MDLLFGENALIGMVHVDALPGTPRHRLPLREIVANAVREARVLVEAGFDALIVENMHDTPYVCAPGVGGGLTGAGGMGGGSMGPEITAAMTRVAVAVREAAPAMPCGVQILSGAHREALGVAMTAEMDFIRCENFVYAHVADEGIMATAAAGDLLRYRRMIGAERVRVLADIKKKHAAHAITGDVSLIDAAQTAEFFGADGVIVTGSATGKPTDPQDVAEAKAAVKIPVVVGSGATAQSVRTLLKHADAIIVGSSIKDGGVWSNPLSPERCRAFVAAARGV